MNTTLGQGAPAEKFITVVSGLPRSGTSLMMQMLEAGGLPTLTDGLRVPDPDNPRGYFEYEPVKDLPRDASWLAEAMGRAVKIVSQLLQYLPEGFDYRVVFMERHGVEVIDSQDKMLARLGKASEELDRDRLMEIFAHQVFQAKTWLARRKIPVLYVDYLDCLVNPAATTARLNDFLGGGFDESGMAAVVDRGLYRHRRGEV
jgi:hypothetical protein